MATLSPVHLGIIISIAFLALLLLRPVLVKRFVEIAEPLAQPRRAFLLDFAICISASILINVYNFLALGFPLQNSGSLIIGCIIAGFFIGLDSSLSKERQVILTAMKSGENGPRSIRYYPMTRKFTLFAVTTFIFVSLILVMVFVRDIEWLANISQNVDSIVNAQLSVTYEILFIMSVLMILTINLILSYSKNLKLLFNNETQILEKVKNGDLSRKVPVATQDEFGLIADHTNHMIDGLRHRFELISSLKFAEEVQQNLLPTKSPYLRDYDVSGFSLYCDQTGGDYYDYFLLPDDKLGITVADACGHGVGAAMLMTTVRAFLISAVENYTDPATLLNQINGLISKDCAASGNFTTMFFLEIDSRERKIQWIRAGHEPALHYHKQTGQITKLDGDGVVLGIDGSFLFKNQVSDDFQSGDIILIGTDGIYETRNAKNVAFGQDSVKDLFAKHSDKTAAAIQKVLVSEVRQFRGALNQEDDITLVVIKAQ
ncbi:MAG: SpoIIE family protein phosphatase [Deltaproteobacteria bacterium]|nr:SpoIIE family protein phosphatase [Deltaproteobacteria bacterium]